MSNKGQKFHPQALTTPEVEALMAACSPTSPTGRRNRALIATLWRGALRCEEALQLKLHDLDEATGTIRILPVHTISVFLGHSNVGTTDRYIQHLNPRQVLDAMTNPEREYR